MLNDCSLISQKIVFQAKHCLQAQILFYKLVSCCFDESYLASFFPFLCVRCGHRKQDGGAERQKRERLFAILKHFCVFQKYKIRIPRIVIDHVHIFDLPTVWPDWAIYFTLGNFSKPAGTIVLPTSLGNFCKGVKNLSFLVKSFLGNFLWYLVTFYWSHCLPPSAEGTRQKLSLTSLCSWPPAWLVWI